MDNPNSGFSLDRLNNIDAKRVALVAMAISDAVQRFPAELQAAGIAVMLDLIARKHGLHVGTVMQVANNILTRTGHDKVTALKAATEYVRHEL